MVAERFSDLSRHQARRDEADSYQPDSARGIRHSQRSRALIDNEWLELKRECC